jgi:hypothetical protein
MIRQYQQFCNFARRIYAVEQSLRALALKQPTYHHGEPLIMLAVELRRMLDRHQDNCGLCQAALEHRGQLSWSAFANPAGPTRPANRRGRLDV